MGIRHHRHMLKDERQMGKISCLFEGPGFDIVKPELYR